MAEAYTDFARVYDELMDATPYGEWCERIDRLIGTFGVTEPVNAVRDSAGWKEDENSPEGRDALLASERNLVVGLGCGTGTLTEMLYQKGYDMIGVDCSEAMLGIAEEKRSESGSQILYLNQDMRELELYSTVGCVISVCDSLNYLLEEEELAQVFAGVENYLYPGGIFIFDFNTDYKYREVIGDTIIAENRDNCSFIWENTYYAEEQINEYDLTIFVRKEGELYERFDETHLQRGYTPECIKRLLEESHLQEVLMLDADTNGEVTGTSERILVVAKEYRKTE